MTESSRHFAILLDVLVASRLYFTLNFIVVTYYVTTTTTTTVVQNYSTDSMTGSGHLEVVGRRARSHVELC